MQNKNFWFWKLSKPLIKVTFFDVKNDVLKCFTKFTRNYLCRSVILKEKYPADLLTSKILRHFFCEFCKIFKNFCEWLLTNLFFENNPPAPKRYEKITAEVFVSLGDCTSEYLCLPAALCFHVICVCQSVSNLVRSNYKFSLYLRAEALNRLTCIHIETVRSVGCAMKLSTWTNGESGESQKPV